jgi:hypothetical protein
MGRTACTEPQCLYKRVLYLLILKSFAWKIRVYFRSYIQMTLNSFVVLRFLLNRVTFTYMFNLTTPFLENWSLFNLKKLNCILKFRTICTFLYIIFFSPEVRHRPHFIFNRFKTRHDVNKFDIPFQINIWFPVR